MAEKMIFLEYSITHIEIDKINSIILISLLACQLSSSSSSRSSSSKLTYLGYIRLALSSSKCEVMGVLIPVRQTLSRSSSPLHCRTLNAYFNKSNDYLNLSSIDFVDSTTITIDYSAFMLNMELRQGPADGVMPVFTPINPSTHKSLFVLCQVTVRSWLNILLNIFVVYSFFITIYLKYGFAMA